MKGKDTKTKKGKVGSSFEEFLKEEGIYEEATQYAIKHVIAFKLAETMKEQKISKVEMTKRLKTSRMQLNRLLDPENTNVKFDVLARAAHALGRTLHVELV